MGNLRLFSSCIVPCCLAPNLFCFGYEKIKTLNPGSEDHLCKDESRVVELSVVYRSGNGFQTSLLVARQLHNQPAISERVGSFRCCSNMTRICAIFNAYKWSVNDVLYTIGIQIQSTSFVCFSHPLDRRHLLCPQNSALSIAEYAIHLTDDTMRLLESSQDLFLDYSIAQPTLYFFRPR